MTLWSTSCLLGSSIMHHIPLSWLSIENPFTYFLWNTRDLIWDLTLKDSTFEEKKGVWDWLKDLNPFLGRFEIWSEDSIRDLPTTGVYSTERAASLQSSWVFTDMTTDVSVMHTENSADWVLQDSSCTVPTASRLWGGLAPKWVISSPESEHS